MYVVSVPNFLKRFCTYIYFVRVIVCRWIFNWIRNLFIFCDIMFILKFPSSNCEKVIISLFCSWADVAYGIYKTDGCIVSASECGRDLYDIALKIVLLNTTLCEETICGVLVLSIPACPYGQKSVLDLLYNLYQVYAEKNWWSIIETCTISPMFYQFTSGIFHSFIHLSIYKIKRAY